MEKITLKNGKAYQLAVGGTASTKEQLALIIQSTETLEELIAAFSDASATEQIKCVAEDGSTLAVYDGYTVLDNPKSINDHYEITPAVYGEDGSVTAEATYGRVAMLTLSQPGVEAQVAQNRADIDFLAVMTGNNL